MSGPALAVRRLLQRVRDAARQLASAGWSRCSSEDIDLVRTQHPPRALREIAERQSSDRYANESLHRHVERREDASQLAVLPFVQHDLEPRATARARAQHRDRLDLEPLTRRAIDDAAG